MNKKQAKYDADFKATWVNRYLAGGHTFKTLSKEAKISPDSLSDWVKAHQKANAPAVALRKKATPTLPSFSEKVEIPRPSLAKAIKTEALPEKIELEQLRKALKEALEERDVLKRALRIISAH